MATLRNQIGSGTAPQAAQADQGFISGGLTATGNSQATALPLPSDFCIFTTVSASTGGLLPSNAAPTDEYTVVNHGAQTLSVYPPLGGKVANGSANAAFSVSATKTAFFVNLDGTSWGASVSA